MATFDNPIPYNVSEFRAGEFADETERERQTQVYNADVMDLLVKGIPSVAIGAIDTIAQSLTPEELLDENSMTKFIESLSQPLGQFYRANREGSQTIGEIGSSLVPIIGATKLLRVNSFLGRAVEGTKLGRKYGKYVLSSGKTRQNFIEQIDKEAQLFVDNKIMSLDEFGDDILAKALRSAKGTAGADMFKEGMAANAAIALFYNDSDMFFPDDLSVLTNTAMFVVPDLALAGLAYRFTGTAIKRHLQNAWGEKLAAAVNPFDKAGVSSVSIPGMRGPEAAHHGVQVNIAQKDMAETGNVDLAKSGLQRKTAHTNMLVEQLLNMGKDNPFGHGITRRIEFEPNAGEIQNLRLASVADPSLPTSIRSVEQLTKNSNTIIPANIEKRMKALDEEAIAATKIEDVTERNTTLDVIRVQFDELEKIRTPIVLEVDQSITPLAERHFSLLDNPTELSKAIKKVTDADETIYTFNTDQLAKHGADIGVTAHGKILLKALPDDKKANILGGVNLTTVLSKEPTAVEKEIEGMKLLVRDMSQDWHYSRGLRGNKVFNSLPEDLRQAVSNWTGSSGSSQIRAWGQANDPRLNQLTNAYKEAGMHRRLHEVADDDGTITLWRGESKVETLNPTNDIVSMTAAPTIAKAFGGINSNLIKRRVPVEDVVMIVGGLGDEAEFIIKGNLNRNKQSFGVKTELALQDQTKDQRMETWGLMQKALDKFKPGVGQPVFIHGESNIMELNFAYQLMQKFPDANAIQVIRGGKSANATLEEIKWRLLKKQFVEYEQLQVAKAAQKTGMLKLGPDQILSDFDIASRINGPNPTVGGKHPMFLAFDELVPQLGGELRQLDSLIPDLATFEAAMAKHVNAAKLGEELLNDYKITGTSLMHNRNPDLKPAVLIVDDDYVGRIGREELATQMMANKLWQSGQVEALRALPNEAQFAPIHKAIYDELLSRPDMLKLASRPDYIFEGVQKNKGIFGQQSETFIDGSPVQAMDRLKDIADRVALQLTKRVFAGPEGAYTKTFNRLFTADNAASLDTFNIALSSMRNGWRLMPEPQKLSTGLWGFVLDVDDAFNKKQYKELFGLDFADVAEKGADIFMPVRASVKQGTGEIPTPVAVDDLALEGMKANQDISHKFLAELNFDRRLRGLAAINKKPWYIPVQDLTKGYTVYMTDPAGHVKSLVNRPTKAEALRVANQEISAAAKDGRNWLVADEATVRQYHETFGDLWQNPKNFGFSELQTGAAKGKLGTRTVELGKRPLESILEQQQRNYEMLTRNTFATFFESELNYTRSHILADTLGDEAARKTKSQVHQQYERVILGRSALSPHGMVGKTFYAVESTADDFFRSAWDKIHAVKQPTAASLEPEFNALNKKLEGYNPFKSAVDMLEANENVRVPPTLRGASAKLAKFTTDMVLRVLDTGMPMVNFASLISVTPAVFSAMRRAADETHDMWLRRIAAVGSPVDENFAMPSTTRLVAGGMDYFFNPDTARLRKLAADRGYITHDVAERLNLWTSPKQGWMGRNFTKTIDTLSTPTDWSERMSRDIAFGMSFRIGKDTLKLNEEAALLYAHTHANKIIADFRPTNRAQMFQGAAGMPLGLFTTWAMNWLQRVFGDIEASRVGATFWQAGMQQFLFGANSIPGVQNFVETFTTSYDGSGNVMDGMDAMYGRSFTDWFMHGTLSTATGIDFTSRGDVTMPAVFSGESLSTSVPGFNVMSTLGQGVAELVKSVRQQGFDEDAISEIISIYGVNGFLRNTFQVIQNTSVNRHGATIENEIRTFENILPRLIEMKSTREAQKAREMQRDRVQREIKKGHISRLAKQFRTAARAGDLDAEMIEEGLMDYYKAGGSPTNFKRFLKEQILTASFEKSSRLLLELIRKSDAQGGAARLLRVAGDDLGY